MANGFKIGLLSDGPDQDAWDDLNTLLSPSGTPMDPDVDFQEFAGYVDLDDGSRRGTGLPTAVWRWSAISEEARATLRTYCPGLSNTVYIMTLLNDTQSGEPLWGAFQAEMFWPPEGEEKDARATLGLQIDFRFLEEIGEYL